MILAILAILTTWGILGLALIGWGRLVYGRHLSDSSDGWFHWLICFWIGYAATVGLLQFWNFWLPIQGYALLTVCLIGLTRAAIDAPAMIAFVRRADSRALLGMLLLCLWVADRAVGPGNADDSGNYHYTVIRWANEYPAIPGLANLSAVYTYNNSSLLYAAMLNTGPWAGRGEHVTNGLLVIALFAQVIAGMFRILRRGFSSLSTVLGGEGWGEGAGLALERFENARPPVNSTEEPLTLTLSPEYRGEGILDLFDLVLLTPAVMLTLGKDLPSPKTDLPPGILTLVMARVAMAFLLSDRRDGRGIVVLAIFAAALITLKLSAGVVAMLLFLAPFWAWMGATRAVASRWRTLATSAVAVMLLVGPWIGRNIILNGYPLYPSKVMPLPVDWRVSGSIVDLVRDNVAKQSKSGMLFWLTETLSRNGWGRYAKLVNPPFAKNQIPRGLSWVRPWFFSLPIGSAIEIVLPMAICGIAILFARRQRFSTAADARSFNALFIAPIAGLAFWFVTAPDPRFGWASAWMMAGLVVAWSFSRSGLLHRPAGMRMAVVVSLLLIVPTLGYRLVVLHIQKQVQPLRQVPIQFAGPDHGFWPHPTIAFKTVTNRWGLKINMPVDEHDAMTWGGPLPCAGWNWPPNDPNLRLRREGDLSGGFWSDPRESNSN